MKIIPKALYGTLIVAQSDNTRVAKPVLAEKIEYKPKLNEFFFTDRRTGKKVLVKKRNETVSADNRSTYLRLEAQRKTEQAYKLYEEDKKLEEGMKNLQGFLTFVSPSTYIGPAFNNNGKSYVDNIMSGLGSGNAVRNMAIDVLTPFAFGGAKSLATQAVNRGRWYVTLAVDNIGNSKYFPFFMRTPNSFTRGIGRGNYGVQDLVKSGIVRGNPRGTEVTANYFAKLWRKNRNHFRDIMRDTKIPNIENKFFSRTLTEEEFNAIKLSAKKYSSSSNFDMMEIGLDNKIRLVSPEMDPLVEYPTYKDYVKAVDDLIKLVNNMKLKVSNGLVEVNSTLTRDPAGVLRGRPINERFGANSDYVADGTPLSYWYSDGRNALTSGHDYAGSDWMVKVNNIDKYLPFMHEAHLHHSLMISPRLNDPNVTVYRRVFPGISLKVPKKYLYKKFNSK